MSLQVAPRVSRPPVKAGPLGVGAGPMLTEGLLSSYMGSDARTTMTKALRIGSSVDWIRAAERVISGRFSTVHWHVEDPDGETIDDAYEGDPRAIEAYRLLDRPQGTLALADIGRRMTRRQMWEITSRHMGLAGQGCWYLDARSMLGIPSALLYIRPDRLTPVMNGEVIASWSLDAKPGRPGVPLPLEDVVIMSLETPDSGVWAPGLVETALQKALLAGKIDRHFTSVLDGGGRLSGILSPKTGAIDDDNIYRQMVADWRNVTEQPESAKRVQIVRAPVDFTPTVQTANDMRVVELMDRSRDALLALWGVPLSQVGGTTPAGLNGGDVRKYDEAALWQNAVEPRLKELAEPVQGIMDLFESLLGWAPRFVLDLPTFDDDAPSYDSLVKSLGVAMRNSERRTLIGLDPFGDEVIGSTGAPLDDEIWVPLNVQPLGAATAHVTPMPVVTPDAPDGPLDAGATMDEDGDAPDVEADASVVGMKARDLRASTTALRASVEKRVTPVLARSVAEVLRDQRAEVVRRVRERYDHLTGKPDDDAAWWSGPKWDRAMTRALRPGMAGIVETVSDHLTTARKANAPASTRAVDAILRRGAGRVTGINRTTRDGLRRIIGEGIRNGIGPGPLGDMIEDWKGWDEYRAERIATTELQFAYNAAALDSYRETGVTHVEAIDGDEDEECAARNGQTFTIEEAEAIDDHPNGTLDWLPVV